MDNIIPLRVNNSMVSDLDALVEQGIFPNRNEGLRSSLRMLLTHYNKKNSSISHRNVAQILANFIIQQFSQIVKKIILFGSVAKGTHTIESDLDILCLTFRKISFKEELEITRQALELIQGIDVVPAFQFYNEDVFNTRLKKGYAFEKEIFQTGIILHEGKSHE